MSFIRTLFVIALIAGLVYAGYLINQKYMSPGKKTGETEMTNSVSLFVCPKDVPAFDTTSTNVQVGFFKKYTQVQLGSSTNFPGMTPVTYLDPSGKIITALCKNEDLNAKEEPSAIRPLDTPPTEGAAIANMPADVKKNLGGKTITSRPPDVEEKLGPKKNLIRGPSTGRSVIKLGQSPSSTIKLGETPEIKGMRVGKPSCEGSAEE